MTSAMTQTLFKDFFKISERFNAGTIMIKLGCDRLTATNLISTLLTQHMIAPAFQIGEKHRWYFRIK